VAAVLQLKRKKRYKDPQAKRDADARRRKNQARQTVLREQRVIALGNPIRGNPEPTPFVKSFDTATESSQYVDGFAPVTESPQREVQGAQQVTAKTQKVSRSKLSKDRAPVSEYLNAFFTQPELDSALAFSKRLSAPYKESRAGAKDPTTEEQFRQAHEQNHENASGAIRRILSVEQTNAKQRLHVNIRRCIEKFGRHHTEELLTFESQARSTPGGESTGTALTNAQKPIRAGPDTGSSEVQIAILTARIRRLADEYEGTARQDKVNKRNLRLLLHRRQKLLKYFHKKSRGGPQWTLLMETLGLTDACWRGEIAVQ